MGPWGVAGVPDGDIPRAYHEKPVIWGNGMGYATSNMINLDGPLIQIFVGFLLAIIGCVTLISAPDFSQLAYALFLIAGILVSLAVISLTSG